MAGEIRSNLELYPYLTLPYCACKMPFMDGRQRAASAVAARRGELNMTQQGLAIAAGVDAKTISDLERGRRWPQAITRANVERALGWPSGELERIAAREQPRLPGELEHTVRDTFRGNETMQEKVIAAIEHALRRPTPPPSAGGEAPSGASRQTG